MATDDTLTVYLTVTAQHGARVPLTILKSATPTELRQKAGDLTKIPLTALRLIYRGRMIKDDDTVQVIAEYKLDSDCVLHCLGKPEESTSAPMPDPIVPASTTAGSSVSFPAAAAAAVPSSFATNIDPLQAAINTLRSAISPSDFLTAVSTLEKILSNIMANPLEEKYRKVKKQNAAFQKRLGGLMGGDAAMKAAGFGIEMQDGDEIYMMQASPDAWPRLVAAKNTVDAAIVEAKAATNNHAPPAAAGQPAAPFAAGMPFGGGLGGMSGGMDASMAQMLSNPSALQAMLQVRRQK
jgi:PUB domain/Ubiquitin family